MQRDNGREQTIFARRAWMSGRWQHNVTFTIKDGVFIHIEPNSDAKKADIHLSGPMLPTLANVHSHAFQYLMAGVAEVCTNPNDSFWSWRERMYHMVSQLNPEQVRIIATHLYIQMLKAGYSQVGEFHYLHHDQQGKAYTDPAEISHQLIKAANQAGIGMTLLPVLYSYAGFGAQTPNLGQQRFIHTSASYINLYQQLNKALSSSRKHQLGLCFHSLRAVSEAQIHDVLQELDSGQPIHIHIAEQQREVDDCLAWSQQRPVEWLAEHIGINQQWCLIHATHLNQHEIQTIAQSGAVAGLCPTTEANLGDGIFPATEYQRFAGKWAIGSDSHVGMSLVDELRSLEYSQRLHEQQRNRLYSSKHPSVGEHLYQQALHGGNQACNVALGLQVGHRADFLVLDESQPFVAASHDGDLLNRWLFASHQSWITDVYVAGQHVVERGVHQYEAESAPAFVEVIKQLG
ncbi:formimidoylglutamate deiminase [Vibrio sp. CAIM 722]|uniref:Formimidoylglutamate deiminase n=1 Tax=Vibrio eleionomae TaxID=2653505 RepID=A0A7X4LLD2_9VIBR|nr:formimidoylglutamate deiminase [Vibrio eleionomae]MZI94110.1 formimidoylglutamate deiminase [Vibrio eleionomae]